MKKNNNPSAPPKDNVIGETGGYSTENIPLQQAEQQPPQQQLQQEQQEDIPPPAYNPDQAISYELPPSAGTINTLSSRGNPNGNRNAKTINNNNNNTMPVVSTHPGIINTEGQPLRVDLDAAPAAPPAGVVAAAPIENGGYPQTVIYMNNNNSALYPGQRQGKYSQLPRVQQHPPARPPTAPPRPADDPTCLYIFAILAFFFPIIGLVGICLYNCGNGLGPRQSGAFRLLVISTLISIIILLVFSTG